VCYVSATNTAVVVFTIGGQTITQGNGNFKIKDPFAVNIAVIDITLRKPACCRQPTAMGL
jgi:hypothetical protein